MTPIGGFNDTEYDGMYGDPHEESKKMYLKKRNSMLETLKKLVGIKTIELPVIEAKTVECVIKVFTTVVNDLKEIQESAVEEMALCAIDIEEIKKSAEVRIAKCQTTITEKANESDRAKAIIEKISGLLS